MMLLLLGEPAQVALKQGWTLSCVWLYTYVKVCIYMSYVYAYARVHTYMHVYIGLDAF